MQQTQPNTLFNRINFLKKKINKFQSKQLGQLVKDLYLNRYNKLPEKIVINLTSKDTQASLTRIVAVYPDEFVPDMDRLIIGYAVKLKAVNAIKTAKKVLSKHGKFKTHG